MILYKANNTDNVLLLVLKDILSCALLFVCHFVTDTHICIYELFHCVLSNCKFTH